MFICVHSKPCHFKGKTSRNFLIWPKIKNYIWFALTQNLSERYNGWFQTFIQKLFQTIYFVPATILMPDTVFMCVYGNRVNNQQWQSVRSFNYILSCTVLKVQPLNHNERNNKMYAIKLKQIICRRIISCNTCR